MAICFIHEVFLCMLFNVDRERPNYFHLDLVPRFVGVEERLNVKLGLLEERTSFSVIKVDFAS